MTGWGRRRGCVDKVLARAERSVTPSTYFLVMQATSLLESTPNGVDKLLRYGWTAKDSPGELMWIDKNQLQIDRSYQRAAVKDKMTKITCDWSWIGCGAITVARRAGGFYVIDGQHRVLASLRRSDIAKLPCVVFDVETTDTEAKAFLFANAHRKPITAIEKHKAEAVAGDETSIFVDETLARHGLAIVVKVEKVGQISCIGWCKKYAALDRAAFLTVFDLAVKLSESDEVPIKDRLLQGLMYIHQNCGSGLADKRLVDRIRLVGAQSLIRAATQAAAAYAYGGAGIWARGMLNEINRGLRYRFKFNRDDD